jgi:ankyrin repeat protein
LITKNIKMAEATFENLPPVPVPHDRLVKHLAEHPDTPMQELLSPYRKYEAELRSVFAQDRNNPALNDPTINVLPLFTNDTKLITTRARDLASESQEEKDRYMMPLPDEKRRPHGSPAVVADLKEFQKNFGVFSESSLCDMDWSNVVAAGSSVINTLLPVPAEYNTTKRKLREYYHQVFCPASDVDLFLYGLTHEQAIEKIKSIEQAVRDALLSEVTVVRTKYAITIASQYPTRHIQIVLRVYKSIGEILTGFDIDAAGGAYDGSQVYVTPRALGSFITQINHIDLTRRSPSYENRLSKYSRRAFEVYWPELERSRIDPTIYERSFGRSLGLARLLVMERLPNSSARDQYINKRRQERGRPTFQPSRFRMGGNIKDNFEDEVADWVDEADVSNYHTFTVPYGENFHAKKIEKLCYTRDLLLNAEWNQHKDRTVYLHRHPAFFGRVQDVIEDCCGACPEPVTDEEQEIAAKEAEIYISGKVAFLIDDPGRQQIGSFNPLTANDWTDMAYVGNTARLCQSIVDGALDEVKEQLAQDGADPNKRDYTGRTPLQLAVQCSTPEVVRALVESGARITARILDGRTALHMAAARGNSEMIKILLDKSNANEEAEEEKQDLRRRAKKAGSEARSSRAGSQAPIDKDNDIDMVGNNNQGVKPADADGDLAMDDEDGELIEAESTADHMSMTTSSFVKVDAKVDAVEEAANQEAELDGSDDEPDIFKIDMLAWDVPCSPLHLAIVNGHEEVVKVLCDYGADSLLPVKFLDDDKKPVGAILTLVLSLCLPDDKAESMARVLLKLGSTSSQADMDGCTAFHRFVAHGNKKFVQLLADEDKTGVMAAVKAIVWNYSNSTSPLNTAIAQGDAILALQVLEAGHKPEVDFDSWIKSAKLSSNMYLSDHDHNLGQYHNSAVQPLLDAIAHCPDPALIKSLLDAGADPNWLPSSAWHKVHNEWQRTNKHYTGETALDLVREQIGKLRKHKPEKARKRRAPRPPKATGAFAAKYAEGSYARHMIDCDITTKESTYKREIKRYRRDVKADSKPDAKSDGTAEKEAAIKEVLADYEQIEQILLNAGAKGLYELYPKIKKGKSSSYYYRGYRPGPETYGDDNSQPYEYNFRFTGTDDLGDVRLEAYIKMFEAAWNGDIETIKSYTLGLWGDDQTPLTASVQDDSSQNTIFSIAFLRGHYDVAKAILDIVEAQYEPEEGAQLAYRIKGAKNGDGDDDDECDSEEESGNDDDIKIVSHDVGEKKFTIDNIGEVATQVKCKTRPIDVLQYSVDCFEVKDGKVVTSCGDSDLHADLFDWAVHTKDQKAVNFLIDLGIHFSKPEHGGPEDDSLFVFPTAGFDKAATEGPIPILSDIIRRTGTGLPLDHLVKKTGRDIKEKAKFYQGLTVYGKKRKDWANAGRNLVIRNIGSKIPPVLDVAKAGEFELLKWFLSETPQQLYIEFANSKVAEGEKRFKHLADAPGGLERVISKWLGVQSDLLIHCAVMGPTTEEGQKVLKWVIDNNPQNLETKTTGGMTPFLLACHLGRLEFVKILIDAGANQSVRNNDGSNAIHMALETSPPAEKLKEFFALLDSGLRGHLFMQRNNLSVSGTTPFHTWLGRAVSNWNATSKDIPKQLEMFKLLLEYSGGTEIEMLNGAGDTCLHTAVMERATSFVEALLEYRPKLLLRENAVGRTPAEVAYDFVTAQKFKQPRKLEALSLHTGAGNNIVDKSADKFVDQATGKPVDKSDWYAQNSSRPRMLGNPWWDYDAQEKTRTEVWKICQRFLEKLAASGEDKRRLVSLHEANDVARRLGEQYRGADKTVNLAHRHGDDNDNMPDEEQASSAGGEEDPEKRKTDYVENTVGSSRWRAWCDVKTFEKCDTCGRTQKGYTWVDVESAQESEEKEEDNDDEPVEGEDDEMGDDDADEDEKMDEDVDNEDDNEDDDDDDYYDLVRF